MRGGGYEKHLKANVRINFGVDRNEFSPESGCLKNFANIASGTAGRTACSTALTRNESAKASPNTHTPLRNFGRPKVLPLRNFGRPKVLLGAPGLSERSPHISVISAKAAHKVEPRLYFHFGTLRNAITNYETI